MINETLGRIKEAISSTEVLDRERKKELMTLVDNLRDEVITLSESHHEEADSIVSYAETSVREAIRESKDSSLLDHSLTGLSMSVKKFEVSHPTLIGIINNIGQTLSTIGI